MRISTLYRLVLSTFWAGMFTVASAAMVTGKAELKSAGALAIGPNGVLLVGDSTGAAIYALDVNDRASGKPAGPLEVTGIGEKIAAMLGTTADQIVINDMVANPSRESVYLSVSRGRGADATPVIVRVDAAGKLSEVSLDNIKHAFVSLPDGPQADRQRRDTITSIKYVDGKVLVAGLSNEEFSSSLRTIAYPFESYTKPAGIEIFHGSHGRFETNAPVRTFVPYKQDILAAYTCTPLVRIPVSELKGGNKVKGVTIAELGAGNRPLDMIVYAKGGKDFILMANSSRGVMKLPADDLDSYKPITSRTDIAGVPYETIASLKGVQHLDKINDASAMVLISSGASVDLRTIPLP